MNVTRFYRETKYFHIFNIIFVKKSLLFNNENNNNNSFINNTSSKSKLNSSTKASRFLRHFVDDLNDFSVNFSQQRIEFIKTFSFSPFTNLSTSTTNFRRQINVISTEKIIHKKLIKLLSSIIDIIDFLFEQQKTIVVIIRQMLNIQLRIIDFLKLIELQEFQKNSNLNDNNIDNIDK